MAEYIQTAELVKYNANSSGRSTGDCVKRCMSFAFDIPYTDMSRMLLDKMHALKQTKWNIRSVFQSVIHDLSPLSTMQTVPKDTPTTLDEFVDNQANKSSVYIVLTGKTPNRSDHMVCVRDGKIWDSWNSRDQYVIDFWELDGSFYKPITDIKMYMEDLATYAAHDTVNNTVAAYMNKRNWDHYDIDIEMSVKNYQIIASVAIGLKPTEWIDKKRFYDFKVIIPLDPTMTEDEAKAKIQAVGKQRAYDRMYTVEQQEKKLAEEEEIKKQLEYKEGPSYSDFYLTQREQRFVDSLPGWIKPILTYVNIQDPGQYHDSYRLTIRPLPGDPHDPVDVKKIEFEGYDASQIRDMIDRYKKNWEVPFIDYSPYDEY